MNEKMYSSNGSNGKISMLLVINILLVIALGVYLIFFKDNCNCENVQNKGQANENEKIVKSNSDGEKKLQFIKKVNGVSGILYLNKDNKVYFSLSSILSVESIASLNQKFMVEKNDIYDSDTIEAIALVLSDIKDISYDNETRSYILITNSNSKYILSDDDIRENNIISPREEKKEEQPTENPIKENDNVNNNDSKKDDNKTLTEKEQEAIKAAKAKAQETLERAPKGNTMGPKN